MEKVNFVEKWNALLTTDDACFDHRQKTSTGTELKALLKSRYITSIGSSSPTNCVQIEIFQKLGHTRSSRISHTGEGSTGHFTSDESWFCLSWQLHEFMTLQIDDVRLIGLQVLARFFWSFLWIRIIPACYHSFGISEAARHLISTQISGAVIWSESSLIPQACRPLSPGVCN